MLQAQIKHPHIVYSNHGNRQSNRTHWLATAVRERKSWEKVIYCSFVRDDLFLIQQNYLDFFANVQRVLHVRLGSMEHSHETDNISATYTHTL